MASNNASLDAAATERKARLAKLASLKRKQPPSDESGDLTNGPSTELTSTTQHLSGRNYDTETRGPRLGFENAPNEGQETLEDRAKVITDSAREEEQKNKADDKPLDLFALQPKKPNWDLKRDLAQKMSILDQRTDNAIARIVRERIQGQKRKDRETVNGTIDGSETESVGLSGVDLVEGVKVREREEAEEERREKEYHEIDKDR